MVFNMGQGTNLEPLPRPPPELYSAINACLLEAVHENREVMVAYASGANKSTELLGPMFFPFTSSIYCCS